MLSAYDGDEALQLFECSSIDLIILDIMIPQKTGLAVLHTIRQKSSVPILMLTAIGDEYTQVTSFDEQADDYITKPFSMVLLGRRVTALLRRSGQTVSPDIMTFGDVTVDFSGYTAKGPEGKIDITPKEIDLLKLLVEHKGLVLTRSQMLDSLWGDDYPIIDRPELIQLFSGMWMLLQGRILNHKMVKPYRTRKVKVLRAQNASVSLDGRILDRHFPLEITIQPEAITLIIPN